MTVCKQKKDKIREENRGNWEKISSEWDKLPSHEDYIKRINKHIKAFGKIAEEIKAALHFKSDITIKGGQGEGEPEITPSLIWFNGDGSKDLDHETFVLKLFDLGNFQSNSDIDKEGVFGFCKTARKPYDLLVCVSLMVAKHHLGADFKISSDGDLAEWQEAIDFYEKLFKRKAPKQLMNYFKKEGQEA